MTGQYVRFSIARITRPDSTRIQESYTHGTHPPPAPSAPLGKRAQPQVRETALRADDLILPLFVTEGEQQRQPIESMPGQFRFSVDELVRECADVHELGIPAVNLFGYSAQKDDGATASHDPNGLIQRAVSAIKAEVPELCVQTDIALAPLHQPRPRRPRNRRRNRQ